MGRGENHFNLCIFNLKNLSDKKVFELLSTGETTGLFQLESTGMREAIKQMKPNKFDDIIALVALYRPGPMSNIPIYNDCKNGNRKPDYIHPMLKKILEPTLVISEDQTNGRCRVGKKWISLKGNLFITLFFSPDRSAFTESVNIS